MRLICACQLLPRLRRIGHMGAQNIQHQITHKDAALCALELGAGIDQPTLGIGERQIDAVISNVLGIGVHKTPLSKISGDNYRPAEHRNDKKTNTTTTETGKGHEQTN